MDEPVFKEQVCPLCSGTHEKLVAVPSDIWYGFKGWFPVVSCLTCGIAYTKLVPDVRSIGLFYPDSYVHFIRAHSSREVRGFLGRQLMNRRLPDVKGKAVFEIGASNGAFLEHLISLGAFAEGLEPGAAKMDYDPSLLSLIEVSSFGSDYCFRKQYNYIFAWMVLEHLHDPIACLKLIQRALLPGGSFHGSVPSLDCFGRRIFGEYWYGYQVPTHLTHFDEDSLRRVLSAAGFTHVDVQYQANCMNVLVSGRKFFENRSKVLRFCFDWLINSKKAGKFRGLLSLLLKWFRWSGRIEFVARK